MLRVRTLASALIASALALAPLVSGCVLIADLDGFQARGDADVAGLDAAVPHDGRSAADTSSDHDVGPPCGGPCASSAVCDEGVCVSACRGGRTTCGTPVCTDLTRDPAHCGACGWSCADRVETPVCSLGRCVASCPLSFSIEAPRSHPEASARFIALAGAPASEVAALSSSGNKLYFLSLDGRAVAPSYIGEFYNFTSASFARVDRAWTVFAASSVEGGSELRVCVPGAGSWACSTDASAHAYAAVAWADPSSSSATIALGGADGFRFATWEATGGGRWSVAPGDPDDDDGDIDGIRGVRAGSAKIDGQIALLAAIQTSDEVFVRARRGETTRSLELDEVPDRPSLDARVLLPDGGSIGVVWREDGHLYRYASSLASEDASEGPTARLAALSSATPFATSPNGPYLSIGRTIHRVDEGYEGCSIELDFEPTELHAVDGALFAMDSREAVRITVSR